MLSCEVLKMLMSRSSSAAIRGLWKQQQMPVFGTRNLLTATAGFASRLDVKKPATLPTVGAMRGVSSVGLWRLRPYASSSTVTTALLNPLTPGLALASLSLLAAPPAQIAQLALTLPVVAGASYATILAGQRIASGGAFQHNYFSMFLYLVLSFMPVTATQNLMSELMFISFWLSGSYFAYSMLPELILKDHVFTLFLVSFILPLFPLAFSFMPLFNTRAYLTL